MKSLIVASYRSVYLVFCICICFSKQLTICLFHSYNIVHWFGIGVQFSDLFLWSGFLIWLLHLNPQYIVKSWAILEFPQYFWGFHPSILWNLQIYQIYLVFGFSNIKGIFGFQFVNSKMVIYFIMTLMRSLCCLPRCGVSPQISL